MTAPALQVYATGQGSVSGDNLNTFVQSCDSVAQLRDFVGTTGIQVWVRGTTTPNDGGQGMFYWDDAGTAPDDNGVTTIVPFGAGSGEWTRQNVGNIPTAALIPFAGAAAPAGWLLCNGTAVSRTTYSALFTAIGTAYGAGDGSTTFNLPDLRGRVGFGLNALDASFATLGQTGGQKSVNPTFTGDPLGNHQHSLPFGNNAGNISFLPDAYGSDGFFTPSDTTAGNTGFTTPTPAQLSSPVSSGTPTGSVSTVSTLPPYVTINYIIKT